MDLRTLFELAEGPDIVAVATGCCNLRLTRRGPRYQCLCPNPYHHDKHIGSFSINASTKCWGCFACDLGQHRGNVSLVSTLQNVSRLAAAVDICLTFSLITQEEATALLADGSGKRVSHRHYSYAYNTPTHIVKCKPAEELDVVYRSFIEAAPDMGSIQRENLMIQRNLTPEDMNDFFVLPPKSQVFWASFKKRLAENGQTGTLNDILTGVPGFMRYAKSHRWSFVGRAGCLCLITRNVSGQIIGFQMRLPDGSEAKYIGFSSGSVDDKIYDTCCSSGVLVDVISPEKQSRVIALTEGKFKAKTLAKMGVWAISVAGVGNWRYMLPSIHSVHEKASSYQANRHKISFMVCFDADLKQNQAVAKNAKDLAETLMSAFPDANVYFADWDLADGKGIDDVVNAGNASRLRRYPASEYLKNPFFQ